MPDAIDELFIALTGAFQPGELENYQSIINNPIHTVIGVTTADLSKIVDLFVASGGDPEKFREFMFMKSLDAPEIIVKILKSFFITSLNAAIRQNKM